MDKMSGFPYYHQKLMGKLDGNTAQTIVIATCTFLAAALVFCICVMLYSWCLDRRERQRNRLLTDCQEMYGG